MSSVDRGGDARLSSRVEASFTVAYTTLDQLVIAYTKDLSKGGMFLVTRQFLPVNAVVRLELQLPSGGGAMPIICRVAYVLDDAAPGRSVGMGLEFLDLAEERLAQIERFIADQAGQPDSGSPSAPVRPMSIVVVDDEPLARFRVAAAFGEQGHAVRSAQDGLAALSMCLKEPPDVLLSDIEMPRMDGWALLRMVRARSTLASVVIIFLTSLEREEDRLRGYKLGVDDFISKRCSPSEIHARVERAFARQHGRRAPTERKTLRGDLEQVPLASLLSFVELERKTGVLFLVGRHPARIFLRDGRPVRVEHEWGEHGKAPRERLFELLAWTAGQFELAQQEVACEDEIHASATELLLLHATRSDEAARG